MRASRERLLFNRNAIFNIYSNYIPLSYVIVFISRKTGYCFRDLSIFKNLDITQNN